METWKSQWSKAFNQKNYQEQMCKGSCCTCGEHNNPYYKKFLNRQTLLHRFILIYLAPWAILIVIYLQKPLLNILFCHSLPTKCSHIPCVLDSRENLTM